MSRKKAPEIPAMPLNVDFVTPAWGVADGDGQAAEQIALALVRRGVGVSVVGNPRPAMFSNGEDLYA